MEKRHKLSITMPESILKLLKEMTIKFGYRSEGHTIESGIRFLKEIVDAQENGLAIGVKDSNNMFYPWVFMKVKSVEKTDDFFGKIISCPNCGKDFILTEGIIYRENPDHEGMRRVDCLYCPHTNDF